MPRSYALEQHLEYLVSECLATLFEARLWSLLGAGGKRAFASQVSKQRLGITDSQHFSGVVRIVSGETQRPGRRKF